MTKANKNELQASIMAIFAENPVLTKSELLEKLKSLFPNASDQALTWRIFDLKRDGLIESPARATYRLKSAKVFQPLFSRESKRLYALIDKMFPLVKKCLWETRWISQWMELQPPSNWTIIETEKDVLESVFARLTEVSKKVFLDPDRKVVDLYLLLLHEAVIVKPLPSESPTITVSGMLTATPEKMMVDIVAEPEFFRAQQGEIDLIYRNAFNEVQINHSKMLRYAKRRGKYDAVEKLIPMEHRLPVI